MDYDSKVGWKALNKALHLHLRFVFENKYNESGKFIACGWMDDSIIQVTE